VVGGQEQGGRLCVRDKGTTSLIPDQQPKHYTLYAVITQVWSRAPDVGHISARNMSSRL